MRYDYLLSLSETPKHPLETSLGLLGAIPQGYGAATRSSPLRFPSTSSSIHSLVLIYQIPSSLALQSLVHLNKNYTRVYQENEREETGLCQVFARVIRRPWIIPG